MGQATGSTTDCYSNNPVVINAADSFGGSVYGGGFNGIGGGTIANCYALGDVSVSGHAVLYVGGFAGGGTASYLACYAAGNVNGYVKGTSKTVAVGGFIGFGRSLGDCYALGDVFVDASASTLSNYISAGALSGMSSNSIADNPVTVVERCFAKGSVTVLRYSSGDVYAGGLTGRVLAGNATLKDCAALGQTVTVTGGTTRHIGRVYGTANGTRENNYANSDMSVTEHGTYGTPMSQRTLVTSIDSTTKVHDGKDGQDAHSGNFRDPSFWQGLNFSSVYWDFNNVGLKGYPRLRASDGKVMGGQ
jgi:hypothetical protein